MKLNHTYHAYNRKTKKPRRRLLFASLFSVILLLFCGYLVVHFGKDTSTPLAEAGPSQTTPPKLTLGKNAQLAWPAIGQAAIGSVEDGLLARSSDNEGPLPTASMAKVITALAIMEKQPFKAGQTGKTYTLTSKDVANYRAEVARNGSVIPVHEGMELTQYQAMQAMLVASANNMADTLVEKTFGSEEAYVSYASDMVQRMGLSRTVVADASGFSPATASTPSELVTIGIAALKNPVIAEIVAQPQAWIPGVGTIKNTNELLGADGVIGLKTGTTDQAGSCLLFAARYTAEDGRQVTIVGVIMGDTDTRLFSDSRQLLASARQGFSLAETQSTGNSAPPLSTYEDRAPRQ
jgi:serine-type D-Ala-D-Ala carboxypeptidase (penicillin-binding protein 5/6)